MQTRHISNRPSFRLARPRLWFTLAFSVVFATIIWLANTVQQVLFGLVVVIITIYVVRWLIKQSTVTHTLTATHFQQHLPKGGWVLQWQNISHIGICQHQYQGWCQPLPWIGLKIKRYPPFIDSICPRITSEMLLSQRALLYVGFQQQKNGLEFEDVVLNSLPYECEGKEYQGLQAMLANRMHYQRQYFDYDVFISTSDLDRPAEEFVGLLRRYLAASQSNRL